MTFDYAAAMPDFGHLGGSAAGSMATGPAPLGKIANYSDRGSRPSSERGPFATWPTSGGLTTVLPGVNFAPELKPRNERSRAKRTELWRLKEQGKAFLPSRTNKCMKLRVRDTVEVAVYQTASGEQSACFRGLVTCGNTNACAICAAKVRAARAQELAEQLAAWMLERQTKLQIKERKAKNTVSLLTLTISHQFGHEFDPLLAGLQKAQSRFWDRLNRITKKSGGKSLAESWGLSGYVRATETTCGPNGWHPHAHILLFWDAPKNYPQLQEIRKLIASIWRECVCRYLGKEHEPSMQNGTDLRCGNDAARYVQKLAYELSDPVTKQGRAAKSGRVPGRTPFELLADAIEGDSYSAARFIEFWKGSKGARIFEYSRKNGFKSHLRAIAGQGVEKTDEQLATEGNRGVATLSLTNRTWSAISARPGAAAELLTIVETRGAAASHRWLDGQHLLFGTWEDLREKREEILGWFTERQTSNE